MNSFAENQNPNTDFMSGHYGAFIHYVRGWHGIGKGNSSSEDKKDWTAADWNTDVQKFINNANNFAEALDEEGVKWVILTTGQGTGYYLAPNQHYDALLAKAGLSARSPEARDAQGRDLVETLSTALNAKGIKLILYFISDASWDDMPSRRAMNESNSADITDRMRVNTIAMAKEWAEKYGNKIAGWFIDGASYTGWSDAQLTQLMNILKTANPNAVVTFNIMNDPNDHGHSQPIDYMSGEHAGKTVNQNPGHYHFTFEGKDRWYKGIQRHYCTYLGIKDWGGSGQRYEKEEFLNHIIPILKSGAGYTLDHWVDASGNLDPDQHAMMLNLKNANRDDYE